MTVIKILIADDHPLVADSLAMLLSSESSFKIVGTVSNGQQALDFMDKNEVDVLLADYHMPIMNGVELVGKMKVKDIQVRTIMLSMNEEITFIKESIQAGISSYVMKSAEKAELILAIKTVAAGNTFYSDVILKKITASLTDDETEVNMPLAKIQSLTKREIEIVRLVAEDLSNVKIAQRLSLSTTTVETHRRNIMKKLGLSSSLGLLKWGIRNGVVEG